MFSFKISEVTDSNFRIATGTSSYFTTPEFHAHDQYEVYCFLAGEIQYYLEEQSYTLVPGDILIIPPGIMHRPVVLNEQALYTRMTMMLSVNYCRRLLQNVPNHFVFHHAKPIRITMDSDKKIYFPYLIRLLDLEAVPEGFLERDCLCTLLLLQFQKHMEQSTPDNATPSERIHAILHYINTHFMEPLSLDQIAEHFHLSKSYLLRLFKEYTNTTIHNYILTKRILFSKNLLKEKIPLNKVSNICGFTTYVSFYQAFLKITGVSPSQYIKNELN